MAHSGSSYLQLAKQRRPSEDTAPGEPNHPAPNHQLIGPICYVCGHPLPESYEPPAKQDWTTGICGCGEDTRSCLKGLLCPCVLFGQNVEAMRQDIPCANACVCHAIFVEGGLALAAATALCYGIDPQTSCFICEGIMLSWWICGLYTGQFRQSLQNKYHLKNSPCDPCMVHCCMHWCAVCQEHREIGNHVFDNAAMQPTVVSPPPTQEMNSGASSAPPGASSTTVAPSAQSSKSGKHV